MTYMERVLKAVDNDEWQAFRISMKGKTTETKLVMLRTYWYRYHDSYEPAVDEASEFCPECIRVDNYLKALCRGGQLEAGTSLQTALDNSWDIPIRR